MKKPSWWAALVDMQKRRPGALVTARARGDVKTVALMPYQSIGRFPSSRRHRRCRGPGGSCGARDHVPEVPVIVAYLRNVA